MRIVNLITFAVVLCAIISIAPYSAATPVEWSTSVGGNGHYYDHIPVLMSWQDAEAYAEGNPYHGVAGHLVTFSSIAEVDWVAQALAPPVICWIGFHQKEGSDEPNDGWVWVNGEDVTFTNWFTGEPNNTGGNEDSAGCYGLDYPNRNSRWNDMNGTHLKPFIIEYDTSAPPVIYDIPNDQGGHIRVSWYKHTYDSVSESNPVIEYDVQRLSNEWQTLVTVVAAQADSYSVDTATNDILVIGESEPFSRYRIVARTGGPVMIFPSLPDSGYSIDNLSPNPPELIIYDSLTYRFVSWQNPEIPDFDELCLYRGDSPGFIPGEPLQCGTEEVFQETRLNWFAYKARSFDIHGNASEWSNEVVGQYPTGVPVAMPTVLRLYPNQPNPFNPHTTFKYDVPVDGRVTLRIYDIRGALVRTLIEADFPRGKHLATWDGRDVSGRGMASGSYFARLEAGGRVETMRMSLVR